MKHTFNLNKQSLKRIDQLLPRLKYSITSSKIISWLENFEEKDVNNAIDILQILEYISFSELQFRFDDLLKQIFKTIESDQNIIIIPFGKVGKSGSIMTYIIKNTASFKSRKRKNVENVLLTHDYKFIENISDYKHIIFIDDFVGSGKTFCDEYKDDKDVEKWIKDNQITNVYLLSAVIMKESFEMISKRFPDIKIYSEERNKIFDKKKSPLKVFNNISTIEKMSYKYGKLIKENPYGYDNSESLLSFFFGTPNNTLPIIWSAKNDWVPLYPRKAEIKMRIAKEEKKEIAFIIGLYNRLGIDLFDQDKDIIIDGVNGKKRNIKYNSKNHHSIIGLIKLKQDKYDDVFICHLLGLTMKELDEIYQNAIKLNLISKSKNLKIEGINLLIEIKRNLRKETIRKEISQNFEIKKTVYLPNTF